MATIKRQQTGKFSAPQIEIVVHDIDFEPGTQDDKDKEEVGFYVNRNMKFVDMATLDDPHTMRVSLKHAKPQECVRIIVQNQADEEFFGSISVNIHNFFLTPNIEYNHPYKQWVTLFDDPEDDEYDGVLGDDDEEFPKLLCTITILEDKLGAGGSQGSASEISPKVVRGDRSMNSPPRDQSMEFSDREAIKNIDFTLETRSQKIIESKSIVAKTEIHVQNQYMMTGRNQAEFKNWENIQTKTDTDVREEISSVTVKHAPLTMQARESFGYEETLQANVYSGGASQVKEYKTTVQTNTYSGEAIQTKEYKTTLQTNTYGSGLMQANKSFGYEVNQEINMHSGGAFQAKEYQNTLQTNMYSGGDAKKTAGFGNRESSKDGYEENDVKIKVSDDKEKRGLASKYHVANKKQQNIDQEEKKTRIGVGSLVQEPIHHASTTKKITGTMMFPDNDDGTVEFERLEQQTAANDKDSGVAKQQEGEKSYEESSDFDEDEISDNDDLQYKKQPSIVQNIRASYKRRNTINTAADIAAHKRSSVTGKMRKLSESRVKKLPSKDDLGFLFGGSAKPKLATEKVNVRSEKEKSMKWIKDETKRYDQKLLKEDIELNMQATVNHIKRDQKDLMAEEYRAVRRLDKLEHLHDELKTTKQSVTLQRDTMKVLKDKAQVSFKEFDDARVTNFRDAQQEVQKKQSELQNLKDMLDMKVKENEKFKNKIKEQRDKDMQAGHSTNPECQKAAVELSNLELQVEEARRQQKASELNTQKLRENFMKLKQNYDADVSDLRKKLDVENRKRENIQDENHKLDQQVFDSTKENVELKNITFEQSMKFKNLQNQQRQTERKSKLLQEKKKLLNKELENSKTQFDRDFAKLSHDIERVKVDQTQAHLEEERASKEFQKLQFHNNALKEKGIENQISKLEAELRDAEIQRNNTQQLLDKASTDMNIKINLFKGPYEDKLGDEKDLIKNMQQLADQIKEKAERDNQMKKKKDDILHQRLKQQGKNDLFDQYGRAGQEFDKMSEDLQNKINSITGDLDGLIKQLDDKKAILQSQEKVKGQNDRRRDRLDKQKQDLLDQIEGLKKAKDESLEGNGIGGIVDKVMQAIQDRQDALEKQLDELNKLRITKIEQDREKDRLDKQLKQLKNKDSRYDDDIKRLEDEKEDLSEQVGDLEQLLEARLEDIADAEAELDNKEKQIQYLSDKLGSTQQPVRKQQGFKVKSGDLLDELLGNYINEVGCPVPIKRLGNGYYMFGSRKIYAKVLNGKLVIRVGGGYMIINEFISTYAENELRKMEHLQNKADKTEEEKRQAILNNKEKKVDAKYDIGLAGTMHEKRFTQAQLDKMKNNPRAMRVIGEMK